MSRKRVWSSSEWRKKRAEFIKDKACEWCGSKKKLTIHHTKPPPKYDTLVRHATRVILDQKVTEGEFEYQIKNRKACPKCGRRSFYKRITIRPLYHCNKCGNEFDKAKTVYINAKWLSKNGFRVFWGKYGSEIKRIALELSRKGHEYYMSLQDCMVLCKKCNFALHKGKVLCKVCKKRYHSKQYSTCWNCIPDSDWKREIERTHKKVNATIPYGFKMMVETSSSECERQRQVYVKRMSILGNLLLPLPIKTV